MRYLIGFLRFCSDFVIGEDWRIALGVVVVLAVCAVLVATNAVPHAVVAILGAAGIVAVVLISIIAGARAIRAREPSN